jgi:hypothetical protein
LFVDPVSGRGNGNLNLQTADVVAGFDEGIVEPLEGVSAVGNWGLFDGLLKHLADEPESSFGARRGVLGQIAGTAKSNRLAIRRNVV